jgi:hypothetical protein
VGVGYHVWDHFWANGRPLTSLNKFCPDHSYPWKLWNDNKLLSRMVSFEWSTFNLCSSGWLSCLKFKIWKNYIHDSCNEECIIALLLCTPIFCFHLQNLINNNKSQWIKTDSSIRKPTSCIVYWLIVRLIIEYVVTTWQPFIMGADCHCDNFLQVLPWSRNLLLF